jgi:hypothetical protein
MFFWLLLTIAIALLAALPIVFWRHREQLTGLRPVDRYPDETKHF